MRVPLTRDEKLRKLREAAQWARTATDQAKKARENLDHILSSADYQDVLADVLLGLH